MDQNMLVSPSPSSLVPMTPVTPLPVISLSTQAKRRMRTSREETAILEDYYQKNSNPNQAQKQEIAHVVQMGVRNVHFWFQNKRAKENKKRKIIQSRQLGGVSASTSNGAQQQQQQQPNYQQGYPMMMTNHFIGGDDGSSFVAAGHNNTMGLNYHSQEQPPLSNNNKKKKKGKVRAVEVNHGNNKVNLPPISTMMVPQLISIPFYFHHAKFGIEQSMLQWSAGGGGFSTTSMISGGHGHHDSPLVNVGSTTLVIGGTNY